VAVSGRRKEAATPEAACQSGRRTARPVSRVPSNLLCPEALSLDPSSLDGYASVLKVCDAPAF